MSSVLVFADSKNNKITKSSLEAVSYGAKIAKAQGATCVAVTYGNVDDEQLKGLGQYGASEVIVAQTAQKDSQVLTKLVAEVAGQKGSDVVVFSQDFTGKALAPRVAVRLNAGLVAGAVDYPSTENGFIVKKNAFSGKAFAYVNIKTSKKVISILPNAVGAEKMGGEATVSDFSGDLGAGRVTVKETKSKGGDGISLSEAELVVSAGRGLKGPENWGMIEELAKEMGAATACSRPVADIGWRPHHEHVGQTGVAIRPNLYIAVGISGAIQHLAGVNGSKKIVVINTDPEAPFFKAADYGIIGDAFEVVPKLLEAYKNFKQANN